MKTYFKILSNTLFYEIVLLCLLVFCGHWSYGQNNSTINLRVSVVNFPDTIEIGEDIVLDAFIRNEDTIPFSGDVSIYHRIENKINSQFSFDPSNNLYHNVDDFNSIELLPNDSILVSLSVNISSTTFNTNSTNIIIIWPEVASLKQVSISNNYAIVEAYVVDNDYDDTTDDHVSDYDKSANYISNDLSVYFTYTKDNQFLNIYRVIESVKFVGMNVFDVNGRLLRTINSNESFPVKILHNTQPILVEFKVHNQDQPNKVQSFIKLF